MCHGTREPDQSQDEDGAEKELQALFYTKGWGSVPISVQRRFVTTS